MSGNNMQKNTIASFIDGYLYKIKYKLIKLIDRFYG